MKVNLSDRITLALVGFVIVVVAAFWLSIDSIRNAMNQQARFRSITAVESRLDTLHSKLRMLARDYNNWADVFLALQRGDLDFVADNYAITAIFGDMFNAVSMFDGPLRQPIAWVVSGNREPTQSFLKESEFSRIRDKVSLLDVRNRETFDFYFLLNGELNFASASYLLPDTKELLQSVKPDDLAIAVLARALRVSEMKDMERALEISDLRISRNRDPDRVSIPLIGAAGDPVSYISWIPPHNGDTLVNTMLPVLVGIGIAFLCIAALGIMAVRHNATDLLKRERASTLLARTDNLTGLPNRLAFNEYMSCNVGAAPGTLALIIMDLNGFKRINDMVGHQGGDRILCRVGECLSSLVRGSDGQARFVARLGGDEFAIIVSDQHDIMASVEKTSRKIISELQVQFEIDSFCFEINAAQGTAINNIGVASEEELLRQADYAMYVAKQQKSSKIEVYSEGMERISLHDRQIEVALRDSFNHPGEFHILYQPIVSASSEEFVRAEALARWETPALGEIGPESFIRVAEDSDLIIPLGWLLIENILKDVATQPRLFVNINVSPIQIMEDDFVDRLLRVLAQYRVLPRRIEIEVTERVVIMNTDKIARRLKALQIAGITIALDDFGSGFTSLGALRALPFDTLKIDRTLVALAAETSEGRDLVRSVVQLGQSMGRKVVGEGVESTADAYYLLRTGCDFLQGYLYGRPMPIAELEQRFLAEAYVQPALLENA